MNFKQYLETLNINPTKYLKLINEKAKILNYNTVKFADDNIHKLMIKDDEGKYIYFGRNSYNDYLIYTILEKIIGIPEGTADKKRNAYLARATKLKGNWRNYKYSKNNLAINILW